MTKYFFVFKINFKLSLLVYDPKKIWFIYHFTIYVVGRDKQVVDYSFPQFKIKTLNEYFQYNFP